MDVDDVEVEVDEDDVAFPHPPQVDSVSDGNSVGSWCSWYCSWRRAVMVLAFGFCICLKSKCAA